MLHARFTRRFAAAALLLGLSAGYAQMSFAQVTTGSYMVAKLSGKHGAEGIAQYYQSKQVSVFGIEIDRWNPEAILLVTFKRGKAIQKITWLKTDKTGYGVVRFSSRYFVLPQLQSGDLIQVWDGRTQVVSGRLKQTN